MSGPAAAATPTLGAARHPILRDLAQLARLAAPVVAARLGVMAMGLTDTIVVGRYSAEQLGYLALGWAGVGAVLGAAMGLLSGVQVMASRAMGEGRPDLAGAALRRGLSYSVWVGLAAGRCWVSEDRRPWPRSASRGALPPAPAARSRSWPRRCRFSRSRRRPPRGSRGSGG